MVESEQASSLLVKGIRIGLFVGVVGLAACAPRPSSANEEPKFDPEAKTLEVDGNKLSKFSPWIEARTGSKTLHIPNLWRFLYSRGCIVDDTVPVPGYTYPSHVYFKLQNPNCIEELNR